MGRDTIELLVAGLLLLVVMTAGCDGTSGKQVGMIVAYEVVADGASPEVNLPEPGMKALVTALERRLNPGRSRRGRVRQLEDGRIEVSVFRTDLERMQRVADLLAMPGTIEFRILANRRDHSSLIDGALELDGRVLRGADGDVAALWVPVARGEEEHLLRLSAPAETVFRKRTYRDYEWTEYLVVEDVYDVNGSYLTEVQEGTDHSGRPCMLFTFNRSGGRRFEALTGSNLPNEVDGFARHLGIILDGYLKSAPAIRSTISRHGEITGDFTQEEVQDLADVLNTGSLPAAIRIAEQRVIEPEQEASP